MDLEKKLPAMQHEIRERHRLEAEARGAVWVSPEELEAREKEENLRLAKELGCNFMRHAHYPHHEETARLADREGILLWEEIPVYRAIRFKRKATYADAENQLLELIWRDYNRKGLLDPDKTYRKPAFYVLQAFYREKAGMQN